MGNKCDMEDERVVAAERGRQLSEHLGTVSSVVVTFSETIAKKPQLGTNWYNSALFTILLINENKNKKIKRKKKCF